MEDLAGLENIIGCKFKNKDLLQQALTHRSYLNEHRAWPLPHNERPRIHLTPEAQFWLDALPDTFRAFQSMAIQSTAAA